MLYFFCNLGVSAFSNFFYYYFRCTCMFCCCRWWPYSYMHLLVFRIPYYIIPNPNHKYSTLFEYINYIQTFFFILFPTHTKYIYVWFLYSVFTNFGMKIVMIYNVLVMSMFPLGSALPATRFRGNKRCQFTPEFHLNMLIRCARLSDSLE